MFTIHDIDLGTVAPEVIGNLITVNHNTNSGLVPIFKSGDQTPAGFFTGATPHSTSAQSTALANLFAMNSDLFISSGLCLGSDLSTIPFRELVGCPAAAAVHEAITALNLLAIPETFTGNVDGTSATLDFLIRYLSTDGQISPVTFAPGVTLSAAVIQPEYLFAKLFVDAVQVPEVTSVTGNFNFTLKERSEGVGIYPTRFFLESAPTLEFVTEDLTAALALLDATATAAVDVYFALRLPAPAITDLFANLVHFKLAATNGVKALQVINGSRETATATVRLDLALPTGGNQVVWTYTDLVAIP